MKYNLSKIMKRAHEIKADHRHNIWSLCLKMAWSEAKVECKSNFTKDEIIKDLINHGCKIWKEKRIYINNFSNFYNIWCDHDRLGREFYYVGEVFCKTYKNMRWAFKCAYDGKLYYDLETDKFYYGQCNGNQDAIALIKQIIKRYREV